MESLYPKHSVSIIKLGLRASMRARYLHVQIAETITTRMPDMESPYVIPLRKYNQQYATETSASSNNHPADQLQNSTIF